ncbi:MAG: hypothetical protein HYS33_08570 [Acidobacteria bacterium]|nr:hypothetical protein [Acidobacteriota bacterium]
MRVESPKLKVKSFWLAALVTCHLSLVPALYADSEGPKSPTASANDAWTNSANMNAQDGAQATANFGNSVDKITFGFSAVTGTVNGVLVEIDEHKTGTRSNTLVVNLLNVGTCASKTLTMDTTDDSTYDSLGGSADAWSCTSLTPANVNSSSFGVTINANKSGGANPLNGTYNVDHVRVTVTYTPATARTRAVVVAGSRRWPSDDEFALNSELSTLNPSVESSESRVGSRESR